VPTYEITVAVADGEFPHVVGIRRRSAFRALWTRLKNWRGCEDASAKMELSGCGNADMVDLRTIDVVMDVPCDKLRQEILQKLANISDPNAVRLVFCLPTERHERTESVEV
jgi:hypothetical protein